MSITHAAIATTATSIALSTPNAFVLGIAIVGSQFPDCDSTESIAGKIVYPIAHFIEERFPHRTITHSFASSMVLAIVSAPLIYFGQWQFWAALNIGHFCGWFSDCFTKSGVAAFYPSPSRLVIPGNPRARLRTQSPAEYWVLGITVFLAVASINLSSAGGITEQFAKSFFPSAQTTATLFEKYGATQEIVVAVKGIHNRTSQAIEGRYTVLEASTFDLLTQSQQNGKLYKIGNGSEVQIRPLTIRTELGDRITITADEVSLKDIAVSDWVKRLPQNAYISGSLLLDDMEAVRIPLEIESYASLRAFSGQVELNNARPSQIGAVLGEFWIETGGAIVKVRS